MREYQNILPIDVRFKLQTMAAPFRRPGPRRSSMFVYAIVASDVGRVKIGVTESIAKRLRSLRGHGPVDLYLHAFVKIRSHKEALATEKRLHKELGEWRTHGEWFIFNDVTAEHLRRFAEGGTGPAYREPGVEESCFINYCLYGR